MSLSQFYSVKVSEEQFVDVLEKMKCISQNDAGSFLVVCGEHEELGQVVGISSAFDDGSVINVWGDESLAKLNKILAP